MIKKQFAEPILAKAKVTAKKQEDNNSKKTTPNNVARKRSSDLTSMKRPSDYRRIALRIQKEKQKAAQRFLLTEGEDEQSVVSEVVSENELAGNTPIKQEFLQNIETMIDTVSW